MTNVARAIYSSAYARLYIRQLTVSNRGDSNYVTKMTCLLDALTHPQPLAEDDEVALKIRAQSKCAVFGGGQPALRIEALRHNVDGLVVEDVVRRQADRSLILLVRSKGRTVCTTEAAANSPLPE